MAGTVKEAKNSKKKRRLKRSVRKTLGALFMATALVVAAIPVDNLQAAGEDDGTGGSGRALEAGTTVNVEVESTIPRIPDDAPIYTSKDKVLQFAYVLDGTRRVAVIVGYQPGYVAGETFTIPNTVDAYKQYNPTQGTFEGYVAVGQIGNFLFYRERATQKYSEADFQKLTLGQKPDYYEKIGEGTEQDGTKYITVEFEVGPYRPCSMADSGDAPWEKLDREELYYDSNVDPGKPSDTTIVPSANDGFIRVAASQDYQRIENAVVTYIGDQYVDAEGKIHDVTREEEGVFSGQANIVTLSVGPEFKGIGKYAFSGAGVTSISLENGLNCIAEGAFKDCIQLQNISLSLNCPLTGIGKKAFMGCTQLASFKMPWSVRKIGDSVFQGCMKLREVDLCSHGTDVSGTNSNLLQEVGNDVFKDCEILQSVTFPDGYTKDVDVAIFSGCNSLEYLATRNTTMNFTAKGNDYTAFKNMVGEEFYFEGLDNSTIHETAKRECIAFSYLGKDASGNFIKQGLFEITLPEPKSSTSTNTFVVTTENKLHSYSTTGGARTVVVPRKIGPHVVSSFEPEVFANKMDMEMVVIPNTVNDIGERAFQGSYNLSDVIFDSFDSGMDVKVGSDAFKTQAGNTAASPNAELHITGPVSSSFGPYAYAMNESNTYTSGSQAAQYITYYSGWPQNLTIQYNKDTHLSELVDFPSLQGNSGLASYTSDKYKYLALPGMPTDSNGLTEYEAAMQSAQYPGSNPNQQAIIDAAVNLSVPEGVQSIREGLIKERCDADATFGSTIMKTVTAQSLKAITAPQVNADGSVNADHPGTFAGCENLSSIKLNSISFEDGTNEGIPQIGDYAFLNCKGLTELALPITVSEMGIAPFLGCDKLSFVNFQNNPDFVCEKSIVYGRAADGTEKGKLIECLGGRTGGYVESSELAGVTELANDAFKGTNVFEVDLGESKIANVPRGAFVNTTSLNRVIFPHTLSKFEDGAFQGSTVNYIAVKSVGNIRCEPDAFTGLVDNSGNPRIYGDVAWRCGEGTVAEQIGDLWGFDVGSLDVERFYKVIFVYWDNEQQKEVQVDAEEQYSSVNDVVFPVEVGSESEQNGEKMILTEWKLSQSENTWFFTAVYNKPQWKVTFVDSGMHFDPIEVWVENGGNVMNNPTVKELVEKAKEFGITGFKCNDGDLTQVTKDLTATADYGTEHTLTIQGGTMQEGETTGSFQAGTKIIITANEPEAGKEFVSWSSLPDLADSTILNKTNPQTVFTMPNEDIVVIADFRDISGGNGSDPARSHTLTVRGGSGSGTYKTGDQVIITADPPAEGKIFSEWTFVPANTVLMDKTKTETVLTMPDANVTIMAHYVDFVPEPTPSPSPGPGNPDDPGNPEPSPTPGTMHSLIVHNGSNSGSYLPGQQIIVVANDPPEGQEFSSWTVSPAATVVTDKNLSAIVVTMPDFDVALVANYKAIRTGSGNTTGSSNTTGSNNSTGTSNTTGPRPSGNAPVGGSTSVVVDKNGLSNTGVVNATVNGSSDNFVVKVSENSAATEAILKALLAEYGKLDNIKYVPMDISLYDSTGTRKIYDTTGLSVTLILPIPDSLIPYEGNNRVAGVVNDRLDKLPVKFTTINGVSCVTFTAEHFSPYVIYVDTGKAVSSGGTSDVSDSTPKTGDGIHPKWFLSIGLASLSFVMFMQKDNKKKKQKVAVKAR